MEDAEYKEDEVLEMINSLKSKNWGERFEAARTLGEIGDARAVGPLKIALKDPHPWVRKAAAEALGRIGDPGAVDALAEALEDVDANVRFSAAEALGEIGDARAIEPLIYALVDISEGVSSQVSGALKSIYKRLTGEEFKLDEGIKEYLMFDWGEYYVKLKEIWLKWWEENRSRFETK